MNGFTNSQETIIGAVKMINVLASMSVYNGEENPPSPELLADAANLSWQLTELAEVMGVMAAEASRNQAEKY